jgi:hypothetical protein
MYWCVGVRKKVITPQSYFQTNFIFIFQKKTIIFEFFSFFKELIFCPNSAHPRVETKMRFFIFAKLRKWADFRNILRNFALQKCFVFAKILLIFHKNFCKNEKLLFLQKFLRKQKMPIFMKLTVIFFFLLKI